MALYVAFLRGMNLGRRRIRTEELCACFESTGFERVSAFLASGNVIFEAKKRARPSLEKRVADILRTRLAYEVPTYIRSGDEVAAIAVHQPFSASILGKTRGKLQVALLASEPHATALRRVEDFSTADDRLALQGRELYWLPKGGLSDSELDLRALESILGAVTIRTHRTMVRLSAKLGQR